MRKAFGLGAVTTLLAGLIIGVIATSASATTQNLTATLTGAAEVPANASTYSGNATFQINDVTNQVCVQSSINNPVNDPVTANHIHTGAAGQSNPPLIDFGNNQNTCVPASPADIAAILANPSGFYYNVHTELFPGGGARGQLVLVPPTTTTVTSASTTTTTLISTSTTAVACLPNYVGYCVPPGYTVNQVNCTQTANTLFRVPVVVRIVGSDPYNLDQGGIPGIGCEDNPDPNGFLGTGAAAATQSTPRFTG